MVVHARPPMDFEIEATLNSLSEGIDRRKVGAATYRAFVLLRVEIHSVAAPPMEPPPPGMFDFSSER
jgi:hypothetical protein